MKNKYIFPDFLATTMSKVDQRTQYEASMMSMALMTIGLIITTIYVWIYINFVLWFKIVITLNSLAGFVFMSSYLVTTYQQYLSYLDALEFQMEMSVMKGGNSNNAKINK